MSSEKREGSFVSFVEGFVKSGCYKDFYGPIYLELDTDR